MYIYWLDSFPNTVTERTGLGEVLTVLISRDLAPSATQTQALLVWDTLTCPRHDVQSRVTKCPRLAFIVGACC